VLSKYLTYEYYNYPSTWLKDFRKGIEQVTVAQVREAAERHLRPQDLAACRHTAQPPCRSYTRRTLR